MFTGIIEKTGVLTKRTINEDGSGTIELLSSSWDSDLQEGESIAVNGVCLSLERARVEKDKLALSFSVLKESFDRTTLGSLKKGVVLNLERALRADSRIGGHIVSGHVDGVADVALMKKLGRDWKLEVSPPKELLDQIVLKGSIAIDGVSLTIAELTEKTFSVFLIPLTISDTSLGKLTAGSKVNIETDIFGKYALKAMQNYFPPKINGLDIEFLRKAGF